MTLREIAEEVNVSVSTVSRVLNNKTGCANREVYDRIWEIVRRENYMPNPMARQLRMGEGASAQQQRIISCLLARSFTSIDDPFFSQLTQSINTQAYRQNYLVKNLYTAQDFLQPENLASLSDQQSQGILIMGRCDKSLLKVLKKNFRYVGYAGLNELNAKYDQVICDSRRASEAAVEYLIELGHKRIGYIGETENESRYEGYRSALERAGIPFDDWLVADVPVSLEGGSDGAKRLLERTQKLTAVFCANDMTAVGAIRTLRGAKKRIPQDVSVISIDDIPIANYLSPALTTVHIPIDEMGQMAVRVLIDRIMGGHQLPMRIDLPFYLVERDSCAPVRSG